MLFSKKNKSDNTTTQDDPNQLGGFSKSELTQIIALISISITMIGAVALIIIVAMNLDWKDPQILAIGLKLLDQIAVMFAAIGHSSILILGLGGATGIIAVGYKMGLNSANANNNQTGPTTPVEPPTAPSNTDKGVKAP